jgi:hypothetical protein
MSSLQHKYRNKLSALFLCIYLSFLVVGIFHHHHYNLDNPKSFNIDHNQTPLANFDLTDDYYPCFLNSFSSTILNYQFPSLGIVKPLTRCCERLSVEKKDFKSTPHFNYLSLRAPPAFS